MKNVGKILLGLVMVATVSAGVSYVTIKRTGIKTAYEASATTGNSKVKLVNISAPSGIETDFTIAAEQTVNAVVNISSKTMRSVNQSVDLFEYFFGNQGQSPRQQQQEPQVGIGSGVIITPDGYIITNNHVIEGADELSVTLNDKTTYTAKVVGSDPNTDIALIKVDGKDLPTIPFGNSDDLKVGEWVLAVGNPLNLSSTVTAGIVSAKGRNLGIIDSQNNYNNNNNKSTMSIESFIQTDAAVNPGNSGGALVNLRGELVGINTAIISQTGSYSGYSFAIPVSIVARVVGDIKQFGSFQRPYLGVSIRDIDAEFAKDKNISVRDGVYVLSVVEKSGALEAGIKEGDIIFDINGTNVNKASELTEQVSRYHPGDVIEVKAKRGDKILTFKVKLRNRQGGTETLKTDGVEVLGAAFGKLSDELKRQLNISYGVQVTGVTDGKFKEVGIRKGFIILKVNDIKVQSEDQIEKIVKDIQSDANFDEKGIFVVGMYPNGKVTYYAIDLNE